MPNILRASATCRRFPQIASLIIHTARLSFAGTSTDLPPISGICQRFIKTCRRVKNWAKIVQCELGIKPGSHCAILTTIWSSETNFENPKRFLYPRLKSVVFDRWFDMFTDSRLMAVAIKFHLRRNSGSVRRFGAQSCSVTTPTMNVKLSPFFKTSYEQN